MTFPTGHSFKALQNVVLFESVSSTNGVAKAMIEKLVAEDSEILPTAIVARRQTAGRGRGGRTWSSLGDSSLALSLILPWPEGPERVVLPIRMGIILALGLSGRFGLEVRLKWPNDLLVGKKKLGGLLIETRTGGEDESYAVVGLGLNVTTSRAELDAAGLPGATSLAIEGASGTDADAAAAALLSILDSALDEELSDIPGAYAAVTAHQPGDRLVVRDGEKVTEGDYLGVTPQGLLRLRTAAGDETLVSGDVTTF